MERLLICKDNEQNSLLESRKLEETDNIKYTIVENPPEIEEVDGKIGYYALDDNGNIIVKYKDIPKSKEDELGEQVNKLKEELTSAVTELSTAMAMLAK